MVEKLKKLTKENRSNEIEIIITCCKTGTIKFHPYVRLLI